MEKVCKLELRFSVSSTVLCLLLHLLSPILRLSFTVSTEQRPLQLLCWWGWVATQPYSMGKGSEGSNFFLHWLSTSHPPFSPTFIHFQKSLGLPIPEHLRALWCKLGCSTFSPLLPKHSAFEGLLNNLLLFYFLFTFQNILAVVFFLYLWVYTFKISLYCHSSEVSRGRRDKGRCLVCFLY